MSIADEILKRIQSIVDDSLTTKELDLYNYAMVDQQRTETLLKILFENDSWFDKDYIKEHLPSHYKELFSICIRNRIELNKLEILKAVINGGGS